MSSHNLLVLSDVHLGSDLVQHWRPDAPARGAAAVRRDKELVALLDWYRTHRDAEKPWRLVIAGDLVDFVGMSVSADDAEIQTAPNEDEREHGLGSSVDHTLAKLARVAKHHADVFAALSRFVDGGNSLVVVRGNHDVDFHWEPVQEAFRAVIAGYAPSAAERVEFSDWFYYEEGLVYVEHGHQYDDYCSYEHVLHPVLASDPRRSQRSLSDILLRYVVRPTRGMSESGHDSASAIDYLRFGFRLGSRGLLDLGRRFVFAIAALIRIWKNQMSDAGRWVREEHERKMAALAEARQISIVRLRALASLQRPPVTQSLLRILAGVMIDRVVLSALLVLLVAWLGLARWTLLLGAEIAVAVALFGPLVWAWRRSRGAIDPSDSLREHATRVAKVFPAAFIVMGHTHLPEVRKTGDSDATYVNLGAWAEEDAAEGAPPLLPASRTHLVVRLGEGEAQALLMRWDADSGPERFRNV